MMDAPQVESPAPFSVVSVESAQETAVVGSYFVTAVVEDAIGNQIEGVFGVTPGDQNGAVPVLRQWLEDHDDFPILAYTPLTPEQIRATLAPLTARQLRLGLIGGGIMPSQVEAAISALPAGTDREKALVEWQFASTFQRTHPLLSSIGAELGLSENQIDTLWNAALSL